MNLFFIELIIVLVFLSISGTVVLKLFSSADLLAERTRLTEHAIMDVQSLAELYAVEGDMVKAADRLYGSNWAEVTSDGKCMICLDEEMRPLFTPDARDNYGRLYIEMSEQRTRGKCGTYCEMDARVVLLSDGGGEVYSQTSSTYIPDIEGVDANEE